jgi:hypothetical protein
MKKSYLLVYFVIFFGSAVKAQHLGITNQNPSITGQSNQERVIVTAVPFLTITPDSRAAGMGDAGVATSPDVNSQHWNAAKYAFMKEDFAVGVSYTPWLNKLINDMWIGYLTAYKRLGKYQGVAVSLRYFDLGDVDLRDDAGVSLGLFNPKEYAFDASYSRKLSENLSMAVTGRFIYSNLIGNYGSSNQAKAGVSGAVDIGLYGFKDFTYNAKDTRWSYGVALTNIGQKLTYTGNSQKEFIPMNLRVGTALTRDLDMYNKFTFTIDANKLMVPTPQDSVNNSQNITMLNGMFKSFGDAPDGFKEELREIMLSIGAEYWYNNTFAGRVGYFYENKYKGNRKFLTFGLGLRYKKFGLDLAYMVPIKQYYALGETFRFTLLLNLEKNTADNSTITE